MGSADLLPHLTGDRTQGNGLKVLQGSSDWTGKSSSLREGGKALEQASQAPDHGHKPTVV